MLNSLLAARHQPNVSFPTGWYVERVQETTVDFTGREVRTVIEKERVLILIQAKSKDNLRIINYSLPNKMIVKLFRLESSGSYSLVRHSEISDDRFSKKIEDYKNKYLVGKLIPRHDVIRGDVCRRYRIMNNQINLATFCGRDSFYFTKKYHYSNLIYLDKITGIELARYELLPTGPQIVWWLKYARFELKRGNRRGIYEIRCSQSDL
jgi:hypothetical protein